MFFLHNVENGDGSGTGQVVSAEGCSQLPIDRSKLRTDQDTCHRESVADTFGYSDEIRTDAAVLVGEEFSASAITGLDFVKNQDGSCFVACLAKCLHECRSGNLNAAYSLDTFDDDGTYVTFGQFGLHGFCVVQRKVSDMSVVIDRCNDFRIVGHFHCQ